VARIGVENEQTLDLDGLRGRDPRRPRRRITGDSSGLEVHMLSMQKSRVALIVGSLVAGSLLSAGAGLVSMPGAASAKEPITVTGGIVAADGSTIAGQGFSVSHPSSGIYTITFRHGTFPADRHAVINVTPGTTASTIVVPSVGAVFATAGGLKATIVLSSSLKKLTPADESFGFTILAV
jgi:hypothetical protein